MILGWVFFGFEVVFFVMKVLGWDFVEMICKILVLKKVFWSFFMFSVFVVLR